MVLRLGPPLRLLAWWPLADAQEASLEAGAAWLLLTLSLPLTSLLEVAMHTNHSTHSASRTIIEQGRRWFRFAQALDAALRTEGSRLWVKPKLHAQRSEERRVGKSVDLGGRRMVTEKRGRGGAGIHDVQRQRESTRGARWIM